MKLVDQYGNPTGEDYADIYCFREWLAVLASPRILQAMRRMPTPEHLLRMLDAYLPYAKSARGYTYRPDDWRPDPQKRHARTLELRAAIERWSSPAISKEITEAARALLREDGRRDPDEGWDAFEVELEFPPDDYLHWPEGVPLKLREKAECAREPWAGTETPPGEEGADSSRFWIWLSGR